MDEFELDFDFDFDREMEYTIGRQYNLYNQRRIQEQRLSRIYENYKNFYRNIKSVNLRIYLAAAKFAGVEFITHIHGYPIGKNNIALIWKNQPNAKQRKRFDLYFISFSDLCGGLQ